MTDVSWEQRMAERAVRRSFEEAAREAARVEMLGEPGPCGAYGHTAVVVGNRLCCSCGKPTGLLVFGDGTSVFFC